MTKHPANKQAAHNDEGALKFSTKRPPDQDPVLPEIQPLDFSELSNEPVAFTSGGRGHHHHHGKEKLEAVSDDHIKVRKRKRRSSYASRKRRKRRKIIGIVGGVAALLIAAVFALYAMGQYAMLHGMTAGDLLANLMGVEAEVTNSGKRVTYKGHTYAYKENIATVLFIGYDSKEGSSDPAQADTVMLLALDTDTGKLSGISIPRDSMVEVDQILEGQYAGIKTEQLALAFAYGDKGSKSCEYTARAVSRLLYNMPVSAYFALNMQGIAPLNDAIGGVALTPVSTVESAQAYAGQPTVLVGDNSRAYVQWRGEELDAALKRQERQVQYMQCYAKQALTASRSDIGVLLDLFTIGSYYSTTNLSIDKFAFLANKLRVHGIEKLDTTTLSGEMVEGSNGYAEYHVDKENVLETVLSVFYVQLD